MADTMFDGLDQRLRRTLEVARDCWRHGYFFDARHKYNGINNKPLVVYLEETRAMLEQGDNSAAIRATQEALASTPGTDQSHLVSILRFYSMIARTEFGERTDHAADVQELLSFRQRFNDLDLQILADSTVLLINTYYRAIQSMTDTLFASSEESYLDEQTLEDLKTLQIESLNEGYDYLQHTVQSLQDRGRMEEALDILDTVTSIHLTNPDLPGWVAVTRSLLDLCGLPNIAEVEKGRACLLLGHLSSLEATSGRLCPDDMTESMFSIALQSFGDGEHHVGAAKAALCLGIRGDAPSYIEELLNVFTTMDSVSGMLKTQRLAADHFKAQGDTDRHWEALVNIMTLWSRTGATITQRVLHFAELASLIRSINDAAAIIEAGDALILRLQRYPNTAFISGLRLVTYTYTLKSLEKGGDWIRAADYTMQAIETLATFDQPALLLKFRSQYARRAQMAITRRPLSERDGYRLRLSELLSTWLNDEAYHTEGEESPELTIVRSVHDGLIRRMGRREPNPNEENPPHVEVNGGSNVSQEQIDSLLSQNRLVESIKLATQRAQELSTSVSKDDHVLVGMAYALAGVLGRAHYRRSMGQILTDIHKSAVDSLNMAVQELSLAGDPQLELLCHGMLAEMWFMKLDRFAMNLGNPGATMTLILAQQVPRDARTIIQHVRRAEVLRDNIRTGLSAFFEINALRDRHLYLMLDKFSGYADIYPLAWHAAWHVGDNQEAWWWVQKSKAQTLLDILGTKLKVPRVFMDGLTPAGRALLAREEQLLEQIRTQPPEIRFGFRLELKRVNEDIRNSRELDAVQGFRYGKTLGLSDLRYFYDSSAVPEALQNHQAIVLVDWVVHDQYIFITLAKVGEEATLIERVNLSYYDLQNWCETHLGVGTDLPRRLRSEAPLRELDQLIVHINTYAQPGDLLVFSPSQDLRCVPLHALSLDDGDTIILERNPIIYATSQSVFRYSLERATEGLECEHNAAVFCTFGSNDNIRSTIENITRDVGGGVPHFDTEVTKDKFVGRASRATLISFFGHTTDAPAMANRVLSLHDGDLSLEDLFEIPLNSVPHVDLVACASTSQEFGPGEEPQGLIAVLTCAGAASVTGTLWPVRSSHGRKFMERFYSDAYHVQVPIIPNGGLQSAGQVVVSDIARTLQQVILSLRGEHKLEGPYAWASYVLHGSWFCKELRQ